jgi:hypothetical protein
MFILFSNKWLYSFPSHTQFFINNVETDVKSSVFLPVDVMKVGATVELKNAKVDMYKGSMRLVVDRRVGGTLKAVESPASELKVKEDNNMSLIEFEQITMVM